MQGINKNNFKNKDHKKLYNRHLKNLSLNKNLNLNKLFKVRLRN